MAAPPLSRLTRALRALSAALLGAALAMALFALLGWIGSSIPRGGTPSPPGEGVQIMVETNGVHTGIVMPIVTPDVDWRRTFPSAAQPIHGRLPTHIAVGWGEREIFLNVPRWSDLSPATALRIALFGGDPVMRISHYIRPAPAENYRPVTISRADYRRLAASISASLPPGDGPRAILRGTNPADVYYEALGHYSLVNTCNSWVGDRLADGGVQTGIWTPFAGGVMKWITNPTER